MCARGAVASGEVTPFVDVQVVINTVFLLSCLGGDDDIINNLAQKIDKTSPLDAAARASVIFHFCDLRARRRSQNNGVCLALTFVVTQCIICAVTVCHSDAQ